MRWWFDHHPTAFQPPALREVFEREHLPTWFFDPQRAVVRGPDRAHAARRVGLEAAGAPRRCRRSGPTRSTPRSSRAPRTRSRSKVPAQRLAAWLAHGRSPLDTARYVEWLSRGSLAEVAALPELAPQLAAVETERARELEAVKKLGVWHDDVIVFDRFDDVGARSPGFLGYLLFPTCLYAVSATRTATSIKISVGVNPWNKRSSAATTSASCARGSAAAVTPWSAASRCAATSCRAHARR